MKIWIDARVHPQNQYYYSFISQLIEQIFVYNTEHHFVIYIEKDWNIDIDISKKIPDHISIKELTTKNLKTIWFFWKKKIFEKEKFHMMIFFDIHYVPHRYTRPYMLILESLKDIFFPKKKWLERKLFSYKLRRSIKHCYKYICLDSYSPLELNEHLNIPEDNIGHIPWFFPKLENQCKNLEIDVKLKHNLEYPYLIYDSGNEVHNNFERILKSIKKLKDMWHPIHLIITCDTTSWDIDIREKVIEYNLMGNIIFLWTIEKKFESSYYKQSYGVIYSTIYESFPFQFSKWIHYKKPLLANDIRTHKEIMGDSIVYLDPLSVHVMSDVLHAHTQQELWKVSSSYMSVIKKYNPKQTLDALFTYLE